jgi:hypothetical protein
MRAYAYLLAGMMALLQTTIPYGSAIKPGQDGVNRPASPPSGSRSVDGRSQGASNDGVQQDAARMARIVARERQKKIAGDTTKLVKLATEVKAAVDRPTLMETPPDAIRKTEEIEKLARDLKNRMSGSV